MVRKSTQKECVNSSNAEL